MFKVRGSTDEITQNFQTDCESPRALSRENPLDLACDFSDFIFQTSCTVWWYMCHCTAQEH